MGETSEKTYYSDETFRVTSARFVAGATTYPMSTINAVSKSVRPASLAAPQIAIWGGGACGVFGLIALIGSGFQGSGSGCAWTLLVLALVLVPIGLGSKRNAHTTFAVEVSTAAGTTQAITSRDEEAVDRIVEALNQAIIDRG